MGGDEVYGGKGGCGGYRKRQAGAERRRLENNGNQGRGRPEVIFCNIGGKGMRRYLLGAGLAIMVAGMAGSAMAQSEIKIGEINSYSLLPAFTEPYRKGWQLAVEEINAAGGINGKKLVRVPKDHRGKTADAQTAANDPVSSDDGAMLCC